jgi:uncharacterized protein (TIGR02246 family)
VVTDEAEIVRVALEALDAAIGSGDAAAIAECCEPDVVFIGSGDGEEAVGLEAFRAMIEAITAHVEGGSFAIDWDSHGAELHGDLALVSGLGRIRAAGAMQRFDGNRYRLTGVLVRARGHWRWKVYHGSEPGAWA